MNKQTSTTSHWEASKAKNGARVLIWSLAWILTTALAAFGPKFIWDFLNWIDDSRCSDQCRSWLWNDFRDQTTPAGHG